MKKFAVFLLKQIEQRKNFFPSTDLFAFVQRLTQLNFILHNLFSWSSSYIYNLQQQKDSPRYFLFFRPARCICQRMDFISPPPPSPRCKKLSNMHEKKENSQIQFFSPSNFFIKVRKQVKAFKREKFKNKNLKFFLKCPTKFLGAFV